MLDVAIAFVLAMLAFAVVGLAQGKVNKPAEDASYRAYRVLIHGIFVLMVVFVLFGDRIVWSNCLTGFAWRAWALEMDGPRGLQCWELLQDLAAPLGMTATVQGRPNRALHLTGAAILGSRGAEGVAGGPGR